MSPPGKARYYCGSYLNVLGSYQHSDIVSGPQGLVTVFFPQDTENEFPGYTMVHEFTHRDLVVGTLLGNLQTLISAAVELPSYSTRLREILNNALMESIDSSRLVHEAVATYIGLLHQVTTDLDSAPKIIARLPAFYRDALAIVEKACPTVESLAANRPHQYRNIVLAIGKFSLNGTALSILAEAIDISAENVRRTIATESADDFFNRLVDNIAADRTVIATLLDIGEQTAVDQNFSSFDEFVEKSPELSRDSLENFVNLLDQRLMEELAKIFFKTGHVAPSLQERSDVVNGFLEKWNRFFEEKHGHPFTHFRGMKGESAPNPKPRIRIAPSAPESASGLRPFSKTPAVMLNPEEIPNGLRSARELGLWMHIRVFINPSDKELSLGPTAPPLQANRAVLVFAPCLSDSVRTQEDRERVLSLMKSAHPMCRHQTSIYLSNAHLSSLEPELEGVPALWHIDWIMYHFAKAAGVDPHSLPGHKYVHMDNADDITFFEHIRRVAVDKAIEGYVQWFGNETLLVATFYSLEEPVFYSIPLAGIKYEDFLETLESVGGRVPAREEFNAKPFNYSNNMALLYHYGV